MGESDTQEKLGLHAAWAMAVGGMVGGGIFSVLGVVVDVAGSWAWLSFLIGGVIALSVGYSYAELARNFGEGGGAFRFLREIHHEGFAGSLSWVLILGYVLTMSVYAFTFGHYLGHVLELEPWFARAAGLAVIAVLAAVNLAGVGEAAGVEVFTVWVKVIILVGLAGFGLWKWQPQMLSQGVESPGWTGAVVGAASVFMAYEGFQLLTYDYDDIKEPQDTLRRAIIYAIVTVIAIYVAVALGATMIVGAETIVAQKEVALAVAGREVLGQTGLWLVTIAAAFSTASAINATLFATARLSEDVAYGGELPEMLEKENEHGVPSRAVIGLSALAALLAAVGSLSMLVEAASLTFLFTFTVVNTIAFREVKKRRVVPAIGALGGLAASMLLIWRLLQNQPTVLVVLAALILFAVYGRPWLLARMNEQESADDEGG